jgi:hypothetical protein
VASEEAVGERPHRTAVAVVVLVVATVISVVVIVPAGVGHGDRGIALRGAVRGAGAAVAGPGRRNAGSGGGRVGTGSVGTGSVGTGSVGTGSVGTGSVASVGMVPGGVGGLLGGPADDLVGGAPERTAVVVVVPIVRYVLLDLDMPGSGVLAVGAVPVAGAAVVDGQPVGAGRGVGGLARPTAGQPVGAGRGVGVVARACLLPGRLGAGGAVARVDVRVDPVRRGVPGLRDLAILTGPGRLLAGLRLLVLRAGGPFGRLGLAPLGAGGADLGVVAVFGGLDPLLLELASPAARGEESAHDENGEYDQHDGDDQPDIHFGGYPAD